MNIFTQVFAAFHSCNTSFTFAKGFFTGLVLLSVEWLPYFFQDNFKVPHLSIALALVLSCPHTQLGITGRPEGIKLFYILLTVFPVLKISLLIKPFLLGDVLS